MKKYDSYKPILKNWLYGIAFYFIPFIIGYLAFSFVLSDKVLHTDVDSARYMLSALIQSEAAIVALVVTLSLVAVQLAAQSYSARVIEVFKKAPDLWILMGIYGIAIFYGLGVLKQIENPLVGRLSNLEGHIAFSYYLGVFAFVALVPYILKMFEMLKPSTVIKVLSEEITKGNILSAIKDDSLKPDERDPIQPIIDIVRGSMMKYDYETIREGLNAIEEMTKNIIENKYFEKDEKEKLAQHVFFHLERVGKLAVNRKDEDFVLEVIISNLNNIGISSSNQKLERAALKAVESLGVIGKNVAEQKLENATLSVIESLKWVGVSAAKQELKEAVWEAITSLHLIGISAAKKRLEASTEKSAFSLGEIGKASVEKNLKIHPKGRPKEAGWWEAKFLEEIGVKAAEYKMENAVKVVLSSLGVLGIEAAKHNLKNTTLKIVNSIEVVGLEAAKQKIEGAIDSAKEALRWILNAELENDDEEIEASEIIKKITEASEKLELCRRLAEYKLMDKTFQEHYKMDFDEFKMKQIVKEANHSFKVEKDYCDWELAVDGIKMITKELNKLAKYS